MRYIIIGAGIAGITAAKTLRELQPDAQVTVYTDEYHPLGLYSRKDLTRSLSVGLGAPEDLLIESADDLAALGITTVQQAVPRLYAASGQIFVNHAFRANYDKLLIATGATPMLVNAPGHHLLGVHQVRNYDDVSLIEDWIPRLRRTSAVIIGGGILGLDMAYALNQREVPVTLVVREQRVGISALNAINAEQVEERLREIGVTVIRQQEVNTFLSQDGKLLDAVELSNRHVIRAGLALCCIGVRPTTEFLEDCGIDIDEQSGGIVVNRTLQTSQPNIYAAGSCALVSGVPARTWETAAQQGRIAALNMLGQAIDYAPELPENVEPLLMADIRVR